MRFANTLISMFICISVAAFADRSYSKYDEKEECSPSKKWIEGFKWFSSFESDFEKNKWDDFLDSNAKEFEEWKNNGDFKYLLESFALEFENLNQSELVQRYLSLWEETKSSLLELLPIFSKESKNDAYIAIQSWAQREELSEVEQQSCKRFETIMYPKAFNELSEDEQKASEFLKPYLLRLNLIEKQTCDPDDQENQKAAVVLQMFNDLELYLKRNRFIDVLRTFYVARPIYKDSMSRGHDFRYLVELGIGKREPESDLEEKIVSIMKEYIAKLLVINRLRDNLLE